MPPKSDRRERLADAALELLSREGAHGVTHRAVDAQARVPSGTTSRYFRTRAALFQGAAERMRDRHREHVQLLASRFPHKSGGLVEALVELLDDATGSNRELYTARHELALQCIRQPELAAIMKDIRADSLDLAQRLMGSIGAVWTDEQIEILGSMLLGIAIDRITLGSPRAGNHAVATAIVKGLTP